MEKTMHVYRLPRVPRAHRSVPRPSSGPVRHRIRSVLCAAAAALTLVGAGVATGAASPQAQAASETAVSFKAHANNNIITAENAGASALIANRDTVGLWETFDQIDLGNGNIALRAHANNRFVTAENAGASSLIANRDDIGQWETFQLVRNSDGSTSLKAAANGKYVTAEDAGASALIANRTSIGQWEKFDLAPVGDGGAGPLPSSFRWSSSGVLIGPKSDASHDIRAVKDPSVVRYNGKWHVFASTTNSSGGYGMQYLSFTDWSQAGSATPYYLDRSAIGSGYKTAPMVFYFAPQKLWYLTYQTGNNMAYSTNPDIENPSGWSAPRNFYSNGMPRIVAQNIGDGYWVDSWVICDTANCHLFSADDNGHLYRSTSSLAQFPNGFGDGSNTVIAASDPNRYNLFEAENIYKVDGSNTYLLIMEALGPEGRRIFRSFTSPSLTGTWTPLAASNANPFAAPSNVSFGGTAWTVDFSSGEAIRSGYDQNVTISPCRLQFLYQGKDPAAGGDYNHLPWRLGLLTQTNSTC
ncbi:non-reducing end alpha-L-arabinofuranosidase family hydrolase [Streptomyces coeruleorubidus]|uniref:non-reducing end alpha-L-arabinofuranosidase family hydrolase n=1 Tax=Streptomyces coeruleorubidus TaxID=116188 RepID=UPI003F53ECC7